MSKKLFLIGTPRSGKSRLTLSLASSGEFAWISSYQNLCPTLGVLSLYNRIYNISKIGPRLYPFCKDFKLLPHPVESSDYWKRFLPGFQSYVGDKTIPPVNRPAPDLDLGDSLTKKEIERVQEAVKSICRWQNKKHFIAEYSKWPRMTFFDQIFPETKFVHITRDGRAVAYEHYKKILTDNYIEWDERDWWIKGWPSEWRKEFEEKHHSMLAYCAYQWKFFLDMIWRDAKNFDEDRYREIKYEELVKKPEKTLSDILEFCGLEFNKDIKNYLTRKSLKNMNYRWKRDLSKEQKEELEQIIYEKRYRMLLEDVY